MKKCRDIVFVLFLIPIGYVTSSFAEVPGLIKPAVMKTEDMEIKNEITEPISKAEIRGLIKPLREAVLSSDVAAKIAQISFKDGEHFKKGENLIQFDCHRQKAELNAAEAEAQARSVIYKNNQDLSRLNAVGTLELEVSKAHLNKALAELNVIKARNQECVIRAPWNGRVTEVKAHAHEVIEPGREIMKILDDDSLEVEMIVPSNWLRWLKPGISYPITVDETGNNYEIKIARVGARVDPVSQTVRVFANFKDKAADVLAGMSGSVIFDLPD